MADNVEVGAVDQDVQELQNKYLTFWTDEQLFGLSIAYVVQIVGMQTITEIPEYPMYAKGVINLRGTMIPVVDMRLRLGKMEAEYTDRTCIIVVNIREKQIGFIVDKVNEVADIMPEDVAPPPSVGQGYVSDYLVGIARMESGVTLLLDIIKMLGEEDYNMLIEAT